MSRKVTDQEKEAHILMKNLIAKPKKLKSTDFKRGKMVMFSYRPKFDKNPYDRTPLIIVLRRSRTYTLGLNWHWCPPSARKKLLDFIFKKNRTNVKLGLPLNLSFDMIKKIIKGLGPIVRLYINNRISLKGVPVQHDQFYKVISLRAETFIGISASQAWSGAVKKKNKVKK